jgi:hypothetical protein
MAGFRLSLCLEWRDIGRTGKRAPKKCAAVKTCCPAHVDKWGLVGGQAHEVVTLRICCPHCDNITLFSVVQSAQKDRRKFENDVHHACRVPHTFAFKHEKINGAFWRLSIGLPVGHGHQLQQRSEEGCSRRSDFERTSKYTRLNCAMWSAAGYRSNAALRAAKAKGQKRKATAQPVPPASSAAPQHLQRLLDAHARLCDHIPSVSALHSVQTLLPLVPVLPAPSNYKRRKP